VPTLSKFDRRHGAAAIAAAASLWMTAPAAADETWTAGSTHIVLSDPTISSVLTIEAGVIVRMNEGVVFGIESDGTLIVNGTEEDPVVFQWAVEDDRWAGIEFRPGSLGTMEHVIVENAMGVGIRINGASPTISRTTIRNVRAEPGADAIGVQVVGAAAAPPLNDLKITDIAGGDSNATGASPNDANDGNDGDAGSVGNPNGDAGDNGNNGNDGGTGGTGGAAVGVELAGGATATLTSSLVHDLIGGAGATAGNGARGGDGGRGGNGNNGLAQAGRGGNGGAGGHGGPGGTGGTGGDAIGVRIKSNATPIVRATRLVDLVGGLGGDGGNSGRAGDGGRGGNGESHAVQPGGRGGDGGNGRTGGTGGTGGLGGQAIGIRISGVTDSVFVRENVIGPLTGGTAGLPGAMAGDGGDGGNGGFGGTGSGGCGNRGDGGNAGRGGHAANGGTGGRGVAIDVGATQRQINIVHNTCVTMTPGPGEPTTGFFGQPGVAGARGGQGCNASGSDGEPDVPGNPGQPGPDGVGIGIRALTGPAIVHARNNIVVPGPTSVVLWASSGGALSSTFNCFSDFGVLSEGAVTGGAGDLISDPLFVNAANGNYRLSPSSPCVDAGTDITYEFSRDTDTWKSASPGWEAYAFDEFYPGLPNNEGCLSGSPTLLDQLAGGTITLIGLDHLGELKCAVADRGGANRISDGDLTGPAGTLLIMSFEPPVRAFYAYYGSLDIGETATMHLYSDGELVTSITSPPSVHVNRSIGHGFDGVRPIDEIVFEGENTTMVVGARAQYANNEPGLGQVHIPGYGGPNGNMIDLDFGCVFGAGDAGVDYDGNPRLLDGDGDGEPHVDIGAFELEPCPADINGDGETGFADLLALLSAWGPCEGCAADIDGNDEVGFADLLVLLSAWGPC